jgi:hypothetical protein
VESRAPLNTGGTSIATQAVGLRHENNSDRLRLGSTADTGLPKTDATSFRIPVAAFVPEWVGTGQWAAYLGGRIND